MVTLPSPPIAVRTTFARDMQHEGWALESDVAVREGEALSAPLECLPFLQQEERSIKGDTLLVRATDLGCPWGQRHAETVLENQRLMPAEARQYALVFPGTVWRHPDGSRYAACLCWGGARWFLGFFWLDRNFYSDVRLLRPRMEFQPLEPVEGGVPGAGTGSNHTRPPSVR